MTAPPLPDPQAICIEFLGLGAPCFVRCVALPGGLPGLSVVAEGEVLFHVPEDGGEAIVQGRRLPGGHAFWQKGR